MESSLIELVYAVKRWADRLPLPLPESTERLTEILSVLNDGDSEIRSLEIDLTINWYVHSRMFGLLPACIAVNGHTPLASYLVEELSENQADPSELSPSNFAANEFWYIDSALFQVSETGFCGIKFDFSTLEYLPSDHRQDLLRRLILFTREFSEASRKCIEHAKEHPRKTGLGKSADCLDETKCRESCYGWESGPKTLGVSVKSIVSELLDASRRVVSKRLTEILQNRTRRDPELTIKKISEGQQKGRRTNSRKSEQKRKDAQDEAWRRFRANPNLTKTAIIKAMSKMLDNGKCPWGSEKSIERYLMSVKFNPKNVSRDQ